MTDSIDRRSFVGGAAVLATAAPVAVAAQWQNGGRGAFARGFTWGTATDAHQIEGSNVSSGARVAENVKPTLFKEPSLDAANSFELWPTNLDLVKAQGISRALAVVER